MNHLASANMMRMAITFALHAIRNFTRRTHKPIALLAACHLACFRAFVQSVDIFVAAQEKLQPLGLLHQLFSFDAMHFNQPNPAVKFALRAGTTLNRSPLPSC